jgi:hypothetical protein
VENLDSRTADGAACWTRRLAELASGIASAGCEIAIWVSNPVLMPWAFARRIAPVQVWWSLKWYGLDTPGIHARITGGAVHERSKRIAGRDWQVVPSSVRDLLRPPAASAVSALRARLPKGVLLGSLCRPEKLVGGGFLAAVARILQACPQAVYLWFGRRPDERVSREMEAHGVADRCRFMGWGDMAVYAAVLDVHLDPFSFPSGTTMLQTAARARAAVFFDSPAARENGLLPMLRPVLESGGEFGRQLQQALDLGSDGSALMLATTADEYLAFARRLVSDAGLRQRSGDALCRALGLVNDPKLTLARFAQVVQQLRAES